MPVEIDSGNTAWVLAAAALVMLMTPGLGFFYAGFTRNKNALATIMQSFIVVGLVGVEWVIIGYTMVFGPDVGGFIGGPSWFGLKDVGGGPVGHGREPMEPHDITMVVLGAAILWFGWFGFNAGSAGAANGQAANAFVVTNTAAASAALTWTLMSWIFSKKPSVVGAAAGAVAGLVAITPASGFVQPMEALAIGVGAGLFCYLAVRLRARTSVDDSLDVVGVHGVGGTWGALATGIFAFAGVSGIAGLDGLTHGRAEQIVDQLIAIGVVWVYSFTATTVILFVLDKTLGLRVSEEEEQIGLDVSQHGERGYVFDEAGPIAISPPTVSQASAPAPMPRVESAEA